MVLTISEADVARVLKYDQLIPAMETALMTFSAGQIIQPVRNMLTIEEGKRSSASCSPLLLKAWGPS